MIELKKKCFLLRTDSLYWILFPALLLFTPFFLQAQTNLSGQKMLLYETDSLVSFPPDSVFRLFIEEYKHLSSLEKKNRFEDALFEYLNAMERKTSSVSTARLGEKLYKKSLLQERLYYEILKYLTIYYYYTVKPDSVYYYATKGMNLAKQANDIKYIGIFNSALGEYSELIERYSDALDYYFKGLEIAEEIDNYDEIANNYLGIGYVLNLTGDKEKARQYFNRAYDIGMKYNIYWAVESAQYNLIIVDTDNRSIFYKDSLLLQKAIKENDKEYMAYYMNNLAVDYGGLDSARKAYEYYLRALQLSDEINDKQLYITILYNLTNTFADTNKIFNKDSAEYYLKMGFDAARKWGTSQDLLDFIDLSSGLSLSLKNDKEAWEKLNEYIRINDSLNNLSKDKQRHELLIKRENEHITKELVKAKNRQLHLMFYFILAALVLVVLVIVMLYFLYVANVNKQKAEDALQYVDRLLENTNSYFLLFDENLNVQNASSGFQGDFIELNEKTKNGLVKIIHKDDRSGFLSKIDLVRKGHVKRNVFECRVFDQEGNIHYILGIISKVNKPHGFVLNFWDNTRNKEFQKKLDDKKNKYLKIFNSFPDIFFILDNKTIISEVTPSVKTILGYEPEEVVGQPISSFFADYRESIELRKSIVVSNVVEDRIVKLRKKDGTVFTGSISGKIIMDEDSNHTGFQGVIRDLTERIKAIERLEDANATKNKLFSVIAHDLVGPIGLHQNILDLILEEKETISKDEILNLIRPLKPSMDATYFMIVNLLSWARIMREKVEPFLQGHVIYHIVKQIFNFLSMQASEKKVALIFSGDKNLKAVCDKNMLEVVIRNLVANAIKFSPDNSRVTVQVKKADDKVRVAVIDEGIGISEDKIKSLSGARHQSFSTRGTRNEKGTGIGLIIVKEFLLKQNSKLDIVSEPGNGSCFCFELPLNPEV